MTGERKNWEQMTRGERISSSVALSVVAAVGLLIVGGFVSMVTTSGSSPARAERPVQTQQPTQTETHQPVTTHKYVEEMQAIPFDRTTTKDSSRERGTSEVTTAGVDGVRTRTYQVTYVDGRETARELVKDEVTTEPVTEVTTVGTRVPYTPPATTAAPATRAAPPPRSNCDPNYSGCVPIASDVDCLGGGGNGPAYVAGPVRVIGTDIYGLDRDGDGIGCE